MADPQEELQFNVGDNEEEATVEMNEDGTEAKVASEEAAPAVEEEKTEETTESTASEEKAPTSDELDNVHDKTKKRINKLTARLREAERREKSAVSTPRQSRRSTKSLNSNTSKLALSVLERPRDG